MLDRPSTHTDPSSEDVGQRVFEYLLDEGPQSTCQVSAALDIAPDQVAGALDDLVASGRVVKRDLPPTLRAYQRFDSRGQPVIFLYDATRTDDMRRRRIVYRI